MGKITKTFNGVEYELYLLAQTKKQAQQEAIGWKRGHMGMVRGEGRGCRRRFYARVGKYQEQWAVFTRID